MKLIICKRIALVFFSLCTLTLVSDDKKKELKAERQKDGYKTMVGDRNYHLDPQVIKILSLKKGNPSKELNSAFIKMCKKRVYQQLAKSNYKPSSSFIRWSNSNQSATYALYGSVFPADERIFINADQLWRKMGSKRFIKYHQLMLGAAVARRSIGVGPSNMPLTKMTASFSKTVEACEPGCDTIDYLSTIEMKDGDSPKTKEDIAICKEVGEYLKKKRLTPRDIIEKQKKEGIIAIAKKHGKRGKIATSQILKMYLVYSKQRPAKRDPFPSVADFYKFLIKNYETTVKQEPGLAGQNWPRFPIDKAPWPLLMPLSKTLPLREAQHIWNRFLGKTKDTKRTQTYGPYRKNEKQLVWVVEPYKWHWNSWPGYAYAGGVCGTMSSIAGGTMTTLGQPMLKAGQPGHSCLVAYNYCGNGKYITRVGQSVTAGPTGTGTGWLFLDGDTWANTNWHASADHHYSLALGISNNYKAWQHARINYLIYRHLPEKMQQREGYRLLLSSLKIDPFSSHTWYKVAEKSTSFKQLYSLLDLLNKRFESGGQIETYILGAADEAIEGAGEERKLSIKDFVKSSSSFGAMVAERIIQNKFDDPSKFSKQEQIQIKQMLEEKFPREKEMIDVYTVAIRGQKEIVGELKLEITESLNGKKSKGKNLNNSIKRLCDIIENMTDRKKKIKMALELKKMIPEDRRSFKKKDKQLMTSYYKKVCDTLLKVYKQAPRMKAEEKALKQEMDYLKGK